MAQSHTHVQGQAYPSLVPRPFEEEKGPGTHRLRMRQNIRKLISKTYGKLIQHVDSIIY